MKTTFNPHHDTYIGSSCIPTLECRTNCSNCPKGLGIGITLPLQCQSLEGAISLQIPDQTGEIYNYTLTTIHNYKTNSGCFCKFPFRAVAVNQCGEKAMLESPPCTNGKISSESPPCTNGKISSEILCFNHIFVGTSLEGKNETTRGMAIPLASSQIALTFTTLLVIVHPLH